MNMGTLTSSMAASGTSSSTMPSSTGMSDMDMTMMPASMMQMVFFTGTTTSLWSMQFTPATTGQYAGTCIFLIIFASIFRGLFAVKYFVETYWHTKDVRRRYVTVAGKGTEAQAIKDSTSSQGGHLSVNGVEEDVIVLHKRGPQVAPWRLSVDPVRALLMTAIMTVGYLLMLAVMTFNIGYFISVLAGIFVGELAVGRYVNGGGNA